MTDKHITTARIKGAGTRNLGTGIYPAVRQINGEFRRVCGYFVSVGKKQFSGSNLQASLGLLVSQGYTHCHVISTGTLQRWNVMSEHQMDEQRAYRATLMQENMWIEECRKTIKSVGRTLDEQVFANKKQMKSVENTQPTDEKMIADARKLKLNFDGDSSNQIIEFSTRNIVRIEITQQLFSRRITFIIHSWDSVRTDKRFLAYDQQYRNAISSDNPLFQEAVAARFAKSRELTAKNFIRRREKELRKDKGKTETAATAAILQQHQINCSKFLDEETPVIPFFLKSLGCSHIYYPGACTAQFQRAYEFYTVGDVKKSWLIINLKNVTYDPDSDLENVIKLLTAENSQAVPQHADLFKRHLDTIVFSKQFFRFLNASVQTRETLPMDTLSGRQEALLSHMCLPLIAGTDGFCFESILRLLKKIGDDLSGLPLTHEQKRDLTCESAALISSIQRAVTPREYAVRTDLFSDKKHQMFSDPATREHPPVTTVTNTC